MGGDARPEFIQAVDGTWVSGEFRPQGLERLYLRPRIRRLLTRHFQALTYARITETVFSTRWLGAWTLKYPTDLWSYQEILVEVRPTLVVETGTWRGGSARFLGSVCELLGRGHVVSVDIQEPPDGAPAPHPRVTYLRGSSTAPELVEQVHALQDGGPVVVILDSDHSRDHVLDELRAYASLVTPGSYLIVEDTIIGNPVLRDFGAGPGEAIQAFLAECSDFVVDPYPERFGLTQNPGGFLRRIA